MTLGKGIEQLGVFAVFCVLGVVLVALYLFGYGLFRSKLAAVIFDVLFGAAGIFATIFVNLQVNNGEFRLFIFVGMFFGGIIAYFVCKSPLDKVSNALYNLFTTKIADKDNGKNILQQKNVDSVRSGNVSADSIGMHIIDNSHSTNLNATKSRNVKSHSKRKHRRKSKKRSVT